MKYTIQDIYETYINGNITIAIREYKKLNARDALAFSYRMGEKEYARFIEIINTK